MSVLRTALCVAVALLAASVVSAIPITLPSNGNGQQGTISSVPPVYTPSAATCTQVEIDLFNIGPNGAPLQDLFQYFSGLPNQGSFLGQPNTVYYITLPIGIFNGGVDFEIVLSTIQGSYTTIGAGGVPVVVGPFNATIDTITVTLNSGPSQSQTYKTAGNNFTFSNFNGTNTSVIVNNLTVSINQVFPIGQGTNSTCASTYLIELSNPNIKGDPQFVGLRGQSYQIHGIDGEVYNIISGSTYQLNSRFAYLTGPRPCPAMPSTGKKSSACWTHPGSYLGELGLKIRDTGLEVFVSAGPASTGFSDVTVNGKSISVGESTNVISFNSTHELTLNFGPWTIQVENSDMFVNLRSVSVNVRTWNELSNVHGLLGQTWSNKRYSGSVSAIEGEVDDYHIQENSVFGDSFIYNKYQ
jgi:hypothetical protein